MRDEKANTSALKAQKAIDALWDEGVIDEETIERWGKEHMRTSYCQIMDEIRGTIPPALKMQMELSVAIANRISDILEEKDMSQKEFARLMGKTETEVSRWLSGTHNLTLVTLCKISVALGEDIIIVADWQRKPIMA